MSATTASSDHTPRYSAPSRRCPAHLRCQRRVSLLHPRATPATGPVLPSLTTRRSSSSLFASHRCHATTCRCLVMPCLVVLLARLLHAAARLLYCMPPKLPKPPRLLLSAPTSSSTACNWSCADPELSVRPRARAHYHHHTSHPCAGPNRVELVRRDPGAASPAPPSSSLCCPSASPSDVTPNRGPECHTESSPRRTCCLLRRKSASTSTARLRLGPPLLRPP
jgi:hypothetical protein